MLRQRGERGCGDGSDVQVGDGLLSWAGTDEASSDEVSVVMRSGTTVHYMRVEELSVIEPEQGQPEHNPDGDGVVDPDYVEEVVAAAVASLSG